MRPPPAPNMKANTFLLLAICRPLPGMLSSSFPVSFFLLSFAWAAASRQPILHGTSANSAATCFVVGCQLLSLVCSFGPMLPSGLLAAMQLG